MANPYLLGLIGGDEGYAATLEAQGGVCAICARPPRSSRRLAIDHDHASGQVRGLLCVKCNVGLGSFGDNVEALRQAIAYLEHYRAAHATTPAEAPGRGPALRHGDPAPFVQKVAEPHLIEREASNPPSSPEITRSGPRLSSNLT